MTAKKERLNEELEKGEKSGFIENFDKEDFLNQTKEKIEVKLNGIVIGYTYDEGKTIEFLDTEEALNVKNAMFDGHPIGISSRKMGTVGEDGNVIIGKLNELGIINLD